MPSSFNDDPSHALQFLANEAVIARLLQQQQETLAQRAEGILRRKGAFLLGIQGRYRNGEGPMGNPQPGIRVIQGTHPVMVDALNNMHVALRDPRDEDTRGIHLVLTRNPGPAHMAMPDKPLVTFGGEVPFSITGVEKVEEPHIVAARLLIDALDEGLSEIRDSALPPLKLPQVVPTYGFRATEVIDLRTNSLPADLLN